MFRKFVLVSVILITLFYCNIDSIKAYEFIDSKNQSAVSDMITQIFDTKEQYEDLVGKKEDKEEIVLNNSTSSSYWWPIGSANTVESGGKTFAVDAPETVRITSPFGYRTDPFSGAKSFHSGLDIAGGSGLGNVNIVAAKDGIVVEIKTGCPTNKGQSRCGGGYGNYIVIQHSDGNYTRYAHLHPDTITVQDNESVEQGQVIAKMGSSGNSTGAHLHFEVMEGILSYSKTVNPLNYISADNPREVFTGDEFLSWLNTWEGHTTIDGDYYIVEDIGDGVRTVGGGVTLENNPQLFEKYGLDIDDYPTGSKIKISIVDQMQMEIVNQKRNSIESTISRNSIVLQENEIQALISQMYNIGNIRGFADAYKSYGNTQELYDNWFFRAIMKGSKFEKGLTRRRNSEWSLFHNAEYVYNG